MSHQFCKSKLPVAVFALMVLASPLPAQQLIGTFTVYYRFNAGGCFTVGNTNPNPYYCSYIPPGPIHINAAPGRYQLVVTQVNNAAQGGGGLVIWSGDATGGTEYAPSGVGITFDHKFGQITLYYNDWYPFDNDPTAWTIAKLYHVGTPCSQAATMPSSVSLINQAWLPWGPETYDHYDPSGFMGYPSTIGEWGCMITSYTMIAQSYNVDVGVDGNVVRPDNINSWLNANNGYDPAGSGAVDPTKILQYTGGRIQFLGWVSPSVGGSFFPGIESALSAGVRPLVRTFPSSNPNEGQHWVIALQKCTDSSGADTLLIADPAGRTNVLSDPPYGNFIYGVGLFGPISTTTTSTMHIQAFSPVELVMTDALGQQTGFVESTGTIINQIPSSSYAHNGFAAASSNPPAFTDIVKDMLIMNPGSGTYNLQVIGTGLGTYTVAVDTDSPTSSARFVGITGSGVHGEFQLAFSPTSSNPLTAIVMGTFEGTLADISNSLQLGLIDNRGIANSLSKKIQAAQNATGPARNNLLNAFKNDVSAQQGKHITGITPEVLLQDADSLLAQTP